MSARFQISLPGDAVARHVSVVRGDGPRALAPPRPPPLWVRGCRRFGIDRMRAPRPMGSSPGDHHITLLAAHVRDARRAQRGVRAHVCQQVVEHLAETAWVTDHNGDVIDSQPDVRRGRRRPPVDRLVRRARRDRPGFERSDAPRRLREEQQILDQVRHPRRFRTDSGHRSLEMSGDRGLHARTALRRWRGRGRLRSSCEASATN